MFADDGPAPEPGPHVYISAAGGAAWLSNVELDVDIPTIAESIVIESDPGWAVVGALGYDFGNGFHTELEVGYRENDGVLQASFDDNLLLGDSSVDALDVMANVLYEFGRGMPLQPYVGVGAGLARVDVDIHADEVISEDDDWAFAYQVIAGLNYPVPNRSAVLFMDYRYLATAGLELDRSGVYSENSEYRSHAVLGGFRFAF